MAATARSPSRGGLIDSVQTALGHALVDRVAGEDRAARANVIWAAPGPRWFAPDDSIWIVHADASMFCGGITALLLQSLHPLAMAGVAGHSGYRSDPWGRLQRTSNYIATTTYATIPEAQAMIDKVRGIHERVRGKDEHGRPYRASDPHVLGWIHAAEAYAFLTAHERDSASSACRRRSATPMSARLVRSQRASVRSTCRRPKRSFTAPWWHTAPSSRPRQQRWMWSTSCCTRRRCRG